MAQDWLQERSRSLRRRSLTLRERLDRRLDEADARRGQGNRSHAEEFDEDGQVSVKPEPPKPTDSEPR
jgi:hypothetical protein